MVTCANEWLMFQLQHVGLITSIQFSFVHLSLSATRFLFITWLKIAISIFIAAFIYFITVIEVYKYKELVSLMTECCVHS
jgi:hypothetical protein